jgi:hypothetical protein
MSRSNHQKASLKSANFGYLAAKSGEFARFSSAIGTSLANGELAENYV